MTTWALIPCSKSKADRPCSAREMYWPSALFRGAWRLAEARGERPLILSAKYGLLWPTARIKPYDETLLAMADLDRIRWAIDVLVDMREVLQPGDRVTSYLGHIYAGGILRPLQGHGFPVHEPLSGMRVGKRLHWFKEQLATVKEVG